MERDEDDPVPRGPDGEPRRRRHAEAALLAVAGVALIVHASRGIAAQGGRGREPAGLPPPLAVDLARDPAWRLSLLPAIGPVRATAIVEDRRRHGPLEHLDQLTRVRGIGPGIVASLRRVSGIRVHVRGAPVGSTPR